MVVMMSPGGSQYPEAPGAIIRMRSLRLADECTRSAKYTITSAVYPRNCAGQSMILIARRKWIILHSCRSNQL